jgi:hypothetical protein
MSKKVPEYIKIKMKKIASLSSKVNELSNEIDNYFIEQGYDIMSLRSGDGISLEELEYGNDITVEFCNWFENETPDKDEM